MGFIHTGCYKASPTATQYEDEKARLHSWWYIHSVGAHDGTCVACKYSFGRKHTAALWCDRSIFQMSAIAQSSGWYFSNRHIELFLWCNRLSRKAIPWSHVAIHPCMELARCELGSSTSPRRHVHTSQARTIFSQGRPFENQQDSSYFCHHAHVVTALTFKHICRPLTCGHGKRTFMPTSPILPHYHVEFLLTGQMLPNMSPSRISTRRDFSARAISASASVSRNCEDTPLEKM